MNSDCDHDWEQLPDKGVKRLEIGTDRPVDYARLKLRRCRKCRVVERRTVDN